MSTAVTAWIVVAVAGWFVVALAVALVIGRMVRLRDRQRPQAPADGSIPAQRSAPAAERADPVGDGATGPGGQSAAR